MKTPEALAKMDCSELISRYLKELGLFDKVPDFTTRDFASDKFKNQYEGKLKFMNESKTKENGGDPEKFIPQSGDIFVWRDGENGHTGIVKEYLVDKEQVIIFEAIGRGGTAEASLNPERKNGGVVQSTYSKNCKALTAHNGWVGYYRPIINK